MIIRGLSVSDLLPICSLGDLHLDVGTDSPFLLHHAIRLTERGSVKRRGGSVGVKVALCAIVGLFSASFGYAQHLAPLLQPKNATFGEGIEFGVDKIANTFVWICNADIHIPTSFGELRLYNNYRSSAFRTVTLTTRDDQFSQLSWSYPLSQDLKALVRQGWVLSRDSRSVGLNSLERLNAAAGVRYEPSPLGMIEAIAGVEASSQLAVSAAGPLAGISGRLTDLDIEQWMLSGNGLADWQRLDAQRTNTDVDLRAQVVRSLAEGSVLRLSVESANLGREFYTTIDATQPLNVEQRAERRLVVGGDVSYAVTQALTLGLVTSLQSSGVKRSYGQPVGLISLTSVERQLQELVIEVEGYTQITLPTITFTGGGSIFQRSEKNGVDNIHGLDEAALSSIRAQEFKRDNQTLRTRMFGRGEWRPSSVDTVRLDVTGWLLRYDTPSSSNDDDRDELASVATLTYARRLSRNLSASLGLSGQYLHLVFLKASRSALNNVNRALRLSPTLHITGSVVRMQPQFEILANYTVYDYEGSSSSVRSFSFRQMSYRDSIRVQLTPHLHVESQVLLRYYERSTLQWAVFAESPETGGLEYLTKLLIFSAPNEQWSVGAGIRVYNLNQRSILLAIPSVSLGSVQSVGPEAVLRYRAPDASTLTLTGWYEFQKINFSSRRELPNLLLRAIIRL